MGAVCGCLRVQVENPERQPLFPPPDTVLSPPRRHRRLTPNPTSPSHPRTPSTSFFSFSRLGLTYGRQPDEPSDAAASDADAHAEAGSAASGRATRDSSVSRAPSVSSQPAALSEESRARMGSISRAYGSRMCPVSSRPTTPRTASFAPHRPPAPTLGRSSSEPRSLAGLGLTYGHTRYGSADYSRRRTSDDDPHSASRAAPLTPLDNDFTYLPRHMPSPDAGTQHSAPLPLRNRRRSATTSNLHALGLSVISGSVEDGIQGRGRSPRPDWALTVRVMPLGIGGGHGEGHTGVEPARADVVRQHDEEEESERGAVDDVRRTAAAADTPASGASGASAVSVALVRSRSQSRSHSRSTSDTGTSTHDDAQRGYGGGGVVHLDLGLRALGGARRPKRPRRSTPT
ncbi:hypothetical protein Q5752_005101 [Cryptotrichosporon argae]